MQAFVRNRKIIEFKSQLADLTDNTVILVVDDEFEEWKLPFVAGVKGSEFQKWKFLWAKNRNDAIKMIEENPDIVILDLNLNKYRHDDPSDGMEILRHMRNLSLNIPVIVHTKFEDAGIAKELVREQGFDAFDYFTKSETIENSKYSELQNSILLALYIFGKIKNKIGILITHGTDTMAFGFSMLKYMVKKCFINIAITGSQIPLQGFFSPSDAIGNLKTSLFAINYLIPPSVTVCFNNGRFIYSGSLRKKNKWKEDAFDGDLLTEIVWNNPSLNRDRFTSKKNKIKKLYLLRTGGTIESQKDPLTGVLVPTGDFVSAYLHSTLQKDFFEELLTCFESFKLDSSCMTLDKWKKLGENIYKIIQMESVEDGFVDLNFNKNVKPILLNPYFTKKDYEYVLENADGIVILGYGAGNGNIIAFSDYNIIELIEQYSKQKPIVISSHVPGDDYDFEYEAGWKLIEAGGIPSGKLSFEEAQVRLSYILGHISEIEDKCREIGMEKMDLIEILFITGIDFRTLESKNKYINFLKQKIERKYGYTEIQIPDYDFLSDPLYTFKEALEVITSPLNR